MSGGMDPHTFTTAYFDNMWDNMWVHFLNRGLKIVNYFTCMGTSPVGGTDSQKLI